MKKTVIVVPVYKPIMSELEHISFQQCIRVLGKYPIYLIAPKNLNLSFYTDMGQVSIIRFEDDNFLSLEAYSHLCMKQDFYKAFEQYDYMLIYQLDAFVFSDRLMEFCDKGYDFIGAPAPKTYWEDLPFQVGNGGFSLRKISSFIDITNHIEDIVSAFRRDFGDSVIDSCFKMEDCVFAYCGYKDDICFCTPRMEDAFYFSVEFNINGVYEGINKSLPFGCHRWDRNKFDIWWPIIKSYGYDLSQDVVSEQQSLYPWYEYAVIMRLIRRGERLDEIKCIIMEQLKQDRVSIWGMGYQSIKILSALNVLEIKVEKYYDKNFALYNGAVYPNLELIVNDAYPIIVTSTKYAQDISDEMNAGGLIRNKNYFLWTDIVANLIEKTNVESMGETY